MSYTRTYVCDFNCATLADGACVICEKHGCADHLPYGIRVAFEVGEGLVKFPPMPLNGIDPISGTSPTVLTFEEWAKLTLPLKQAHVTRAAVEREVAERRCCEGCYKLVAGSHYRQVGGDTVIRRAVDEFVGALRAGMTARGMARDEEPKK